MATGDPVDIATRIDGQLPPWFEDDAPILGAVEAGGGTVFSWVYSLIQFAIQQMRLLTQTGGFLDLTSWEFFGPSLLRFQGEPDDAFRNRIQAEIFRPRVTLAGIAEALEDLTGRTPEIIEPFNASGGGYGVGAIAYGGSKPAGGSVAGYGDPIGGYGVGSLGYSIVPGGPGGSFPGVGAYSSLSYPYQIFITAFRPQSAVGIPNLSGYGNGGGGYGVGTIAYADITQVEGAVTDADIYACVAANTAAGITPWTALEN